MGHEVELKLTLSRKAVAALRRHPLIAGATRLGANTLDNIYYDTSALALKKRGIALRTRRQGRTWLQTVKCAAQSSGGLTQRPEWEQPFNGSFDFSAIDQARARRLLTRLEPKLAPVFTTRFRRETRRFSPADEVRILVMIDIGEVVCGEQVEPICELELELEQGSPLDLLQLACTLADDLALMPSDLSKAERGYRLHQGDARVPMRAEAFRITAHQTPVEAYRELALSCLRQWQANAVQAVSGGNPEIIHQLRVSQRRLRSLTRLFGGALPPDFVADWNQRLRQNAKCLGDARDLDVLHGEIIAPVKGTTPEDVKQIERLRAIVGAAREDARAHPAGTLDAATQGRLLLGFMASVHGLLAHAGDDASDLREFARRQLKRLRKRARKRLEDARDQAPEQLHALRIAVKQLRYGLEFFASLIDDNRTKRRVAELQRVQNALGFINDLDVARSRLAAWAGLNPELRAAAAFVCGWHTPRYLRLGSRSIRKLDALLRKLRV